MDFKTDKYTLIQKAISEELSEFLFEYLNLKRKAANYLFQNKLINPFVKYFGTWDDEQVLNTYSIYGDTAMENLLIKLKPKMEEATGEKLIEMYSYSRLYKNGDILKKHTDRFACEISTTLNLGGDMWPIFLKKDDRTLQVNLDKGDMLVYKGCELEHWRNSFEGQNCGQVFLHYNKYTDEALFKRYDERPFVGAILP
tara:strand:- start:2028 stop:2621 length:594 start_codon:yes stop_codon:yes gene_type:complete